MKYMTHNSWSFLTPKTFLGRMFNFMAKCQEVNIQTQYIKYDVRMFDLRIRLDSEDDITIAHGLFEYKDSAYRINRDLEFLNSKGDVYVRVFLEVRNKVLDTNRQRDWFISYCKHIENTYTDIKFCGGMPTYTPIEYYKFKNRTPTSDGVHASWTTKNIIDDLYPKLFSKRHNRKAKEKGTDKEFLSLDFINIG